MRPAIPIGQVLSSGEFWTRQRAAQNRREIAPPPADFDPEEDRREEWLALSWGYLTQHDRGPRLRCE